MLGAWLVAVLVAFVLLAEGVMLELPGSEGQSPLAAIATHQFTLLGTLVLIGVTAVLSRGRALPRLADRAPAKAVAAREVAGLWLYGVAAVAAGQPLIPGQNSMHLHGSVVGGEPGFGAATLATWALYNFVALAVVPFLYFHRRRGYSLAALNLRSADRQRDALLILGVLSVESLLEFLSLNNSIFALSLGEALRGGGVGFVAHLLGTGLPVMIFAYAILLPRYARLTGSFAATMVLGALTYAGLHLFESWTVYDSLASGTLSVAFVLFLFFGPGLVKTYLTLRTGNAWVHLWGYHSTVHVVADAPLVEEALGR